MALKAYSFTENENLNAGVHDKNILERERKLAAEFVAAHPCKSEPGVCPLCGSGNTDVFSTIKGAMYARCEACWSLYVPLSEETAIAYRDYAPMRDFRASDEYQSIAKQNRTSVWREQLFWITYRTERYLAPLRDLSILEISGRFNGFRELTADACGSFRAYTRADEVPAECADVALFLGALPAEPKLHDSLGHICRSLKNGGLLFLDSRVSTGFDILTLGGKVDTIFPYDHMVLPSPEALDIVLARAGFEVLEISTPGTLDVRYVADNSSKLDRSNLFARYLLEKADDNTRSEFQRFLQKNTISSYAQVVAKTKR